jgi:DNA-binding transcriptional MerR regulator
MYDDNSYFTISKTADLIGVRSHVLRFWEKKFLSLNPKKDISGRRFYSSSDIKFLLLVKKLLYDDGFTIKGAVNFIIEQNKDKATNEEDFISDEINKALNLLKQGSDLLNKNL